MSKKSLKINEATNQKKYFDKVEVYNVAKKCFVFESIPKK